LERKLGILAFSAQLTAKPPRDENLHESRIIDIKNDTKATTKNSFDILILKMVPLLDALRGERRAMNAKGERK